MEDNSSKKDLLLYLFFAVAGVAAVIFSFLLRRDTSPGLAWIPDLLLNVGATLFSTAILTFLYQRFGSQDLIHQIAEMRHTLAIADHALKLGIRDMWSERRHIPNDMWNTFTKPARSEVWLLGVAEQGFASDETFHAIVLEGAARGCHYRFLILDPNSAAAEEIARKEPDGAQVQGRIRGALRQFLRLKEQNKRKKGSVEVRVYTDVPRVSIVRSDEELLVTPYMPPRHGNSSFSLRVQNVPKGIFSHYVKHFEALWENARVLEPGLEQNWNEG